MDSSGYPHLWSIILTGGEGERLRPFVERWQGNHTPKQYCTFVGTRSMFQHTVDRADRLAAPENKVIVIAKSHLREATTQLAGREAGKLIVQPANRDTAAGVFLALAHVRSCDPHATVVIYPSDHFIYPEYRFVKVVEASLRAVDLLSGHIFLLAVTPDRVEPEYGWIQPGLDLGSIAGHNLHRVDMFVEKPDLTKARQLIRSQVLWNTLILAGSVKTIWSMGWRCFPEVMQLFEEYEDAIGTSAEPAARESIYTRMARRNFSSHLLQRLRGQVATIEMMEVLWSDWGRPQRILDSLRLIGKTPDFPRKYALAV